MRAGGTPGGGESETELRRDIGSPRSRRSAQHQRARFFLQRTIGTLPFAFAGTARRKRSHQRAQCVALAPRRLELGADLPVLDGMHEFDPAILADADARLRRFDPAAADALPRRYRLDRKIGLTRPLHIHTGRLADPVPDAIDRAQLNA
ncbi:MAG TPA: hypothetical protein VFO53_14140 [Casimicrobiaceae bacterium]|nr:hypothetical protein [Casimicrobiaceae bacterium]